MQRSLVTSALVAAGLLAASPALAERSESPPTCRPGMRALCSFRFAGGIELIASGSDLHENADGTVAVGGTPSIVTPAGPIPLPGAELTVRPGAVATLVAGSAPMPVPNAGVFKGITVPATSGRLGIATGADLAALGAHLSDDRTYLWWASSGSAVTITGSSMTGPGGAIMPLALAMPGGAGTVAVLDPTDPYLYVGGNCPDGPRTSSAGSASKRAPSPTSPRRPVTTRPGKAAVARRVAGKSAGKNTSPGPALPPAQVGALPVGADCGLGLSFQGTIPYVPDGSDAPRAVGGANVVIDGLVPVAPGYTVDGVVTAHFSDQSMRLSAQGNLLASVPLLDRLVDVVLPVGQASLGMDVGPSAYRLWFNGVMGGSELQLPIGVPVRFPAPDAVVRGALSFERGADGVFRPDPASFLEGSGRLTVGLTTFGAQIGSELADATIDGSFRIDRTGVRAKGRFAGQPHPAVSVSGGATLDAFIAASNVADSTFLLTGALTVGGTPLSSDASLRIDRNGIEAQGRLDAGASQVVVSGRISGRDVSLSGRARAVLTPDAVRRLADATAADLDAAQAEVNRLTTEIERIREVVRAERRARNAGSAKARNDVSAAQRQLDGVLRTIAANDRQIAAFRREQGRTADLLRKADLEVRVQAVQAANTAQYGYRAAALAALDSARQSLAAIEATLDAIPVDTDPRIVALFAARDSATAGLSAGRGAVGVVRVLASGTISGDLSVTVGSNRLVGSFSAQYCQGATCTALAGGRVQFHPHLAACVDMAGVTDACVRV